MLPTIKLSGCNYMVVMIIKHVLLYAIHVMTAIKHEWIFSSKPLNSISTISHPKTNANLSVRFDTCRPYILLSLMYYVSIVGNIVIADDSDLRCNESCI